MKVEPSHASVTSHLFVAPPGEPWGRCSSCGLGEAVHEDSVDGGCKAHLARVFGETAEPPPGSFAAAEDTPEPVEAAESPAPPAADAPTGDWVRLGDASDEVLAVKVDATAEDWGRFAVWGQRVQAGSVRETLKCLLDEVGA